MATPPVAEPRRRLSEAELRARARRRELLKRRVRLAAAVLALVLLVAGWVLVPRSQLFRIRHVEVTGASAVSDLEVRTRVDELLDGETVYTVDEDALARRIKELPFVREVRVERHLPGGLELHLVEYRPLALGYGDRGYWLVARDGRLLSKASQGEWKGRVPIVRLRGEHLKAGQRVADEPGMRLLAALASDSTIRFQTIDADRFEITATIDDDVEVRFGRPEQLRQKVLVAEWVQRYARRKGIELLYIDVSVPSRPAFCAADNVVCNLPREANEDAADDAQDAATTPEERGGDSALVDAAVGEH